MPVAGIGASAGGLDALTHFFAAVPSDIGLAFVVVLHLDPNHESQFSELVSKSTKLNVAEARDGDVLSAGHVYV
jgi:chemotaxis response regulator CheB